MIDVPSGRKCIVVGCEGIVKANDLCAMHYQRSLRHGHTEQTRRSKGVCSVEDCDGKHVAKGLCQMHYYRLQRTGTTDDPSKSAARVCEVVGCGKPHAANGLCAMHYKRMDRHGDVVQTRASDWGAREKHPLYSCWNALLRYHASDVCDEWRVDLWQFTKDIGDSRPTKKHSLQRQDETKPFCPGNVYWREQSSSGLSVEAKSERNQYMRGWYQKNKRTVLNSEMRKRYGIGYDDYEKILVAQNGVCAICGQPETRVDHRTKQVSRLAIDHDHATAKIRGLLCHAHNNSLGHFDDDPALLISAITYLATHSADPSAILTAAISKLQSALPAAGTA